MEKKVNKKLEEILDKQVTPKVEKKEEEMVEVIIKNLDIKGCPIKFSYSVDKSPAKTYNFDDGSKHTIPKSLAKHLNSCCYEQNETLIDKNGKYIGSKRNIIHRYMARRVDDIYGE